MLGEVEFDDHREIIFVELLDDYGDTIALFLKQFKHGQYMQ